MPEPHEITLMVDPGDLVFDIGAHVGDKAQWFVDRGAKVVCVEPLPLLVEMLCKRFEGTGRVAVIPKGVSDEPGRMVMEVNSYAPALSSFAPHWKDGRFKNFTWDAQAEFDMTTLDELILAYGSAKYCKIDVEGFEYKVISGLTSKSIKYISYEFLGERLSEAFDVLGYLLKLGYDSFNFSLQEHHKFFFDQWVSFHQLVLIMAAHAETDADMWGDIYVR
jgi:FkbM family methyltransferase